MKFNLEKAMKNNGLCRVMIPNMSYVEGQIVHTKMPGPYSILVVVVEQDNIYRFSPDGLSLYTHNKLYNGPDIFDVWVTLYKGSDGNMRSVLRTDLDEHNEMIEYIKKNKYELLSTLHTRMTEGTNRSAL